ncbi:MAG TPA: hypothetical protein VLA19_13635 [Herpetosiphonaceae bacterium]|nr:hypothetical protein [Herpetosiphonaceae bacterium]
MTGDGRDVHQIELLDQEGRAVHFRDFRGHPAVLVFLRWLG